MDYPIHIDTISMKLSILYFKRLHVKISLTLKVPITTAADETFCDIFPNFWKK